MTNTMEYRTPGRTGLDVSALAFGCGDVGRSLVRGEPAVRDRAIARAVAVAEEVNPSARSRRRPQRV